MEVSMIQSTLQSYHCPWLRKHHSLACWQLSPAIALKGAGRTKGNASPVGHMLSIWQYLMHPKLMNLRWPKFQGPKWRQLHGFLTKNQHRLKLRNPVSRDVRASHSSIKRSLLLVVKIARRCFQWIRYSNWLLITKRIGSGDCSAPPGLQWPNVEGPTWTSSRHFELIGKGLSFRRWNEEMYQSTKYEGQTDVKRSKQFFFLGGTTSCTEINWKRLKQVAGGSR